MNFKSYKTLAKSGLLLAASVTLSSCQEFSIYSTDANGNRVYADGTIVPAPGSSSDTTNSEDGKNGRGRNANNGNVDGDRGKNPGDNPGSTGDREVAPDIFETNQTFKVSVDKKQIDVLFVVDNSRSMQDEQRNVRDSFETFLNGFLEEDIDFHIGLLSTETSRNMSRWRSSAAFTNYPNDGAGTLLARRGNARFLTSDMSDADVLSQFRSNVNLGLDGSGSEMGLLSILKFLEPQHHASGGWNEGFIREDALLSMVIVSDEDEAINDSNTNFLRTNVTAKNARIGSFIQAMSDLKPARPDLVRLDVVVAPSVASCPSVGYDHGNAGTGDVYIEVSNLLHGGDGHVTNVCSNFADDLGLLGAEIAGQVERRFKLKKLPLGQIEVRLDNVVLAERNVEGWTYDEANNEIVLHGLDLEDLPSFKVKVNYTYAL